MRGEGLPRGPHMKKTLAVIALAITLAACSGGRSEAEKAYEGFAEAILRGQEDVAARLYEGDEVARALKDFPSYMPPWIEAFFGAAYKYESRKKDGKAVDLVVLQTVRYDPAGATSAFGAMTAQFRHHVRVDERAGGFQVVSFRSELLKTWETRKGP